MTIKKAFYIIEFLSPLLAESSLIDIYGYKIPALFFISLFPIVFLKAHKKDLLINVKYNIVIKYVCLYILIVFFNYLFVVGDLFWRPYPEIGPLYIGLIRRLIFVMVVYYTFSDEKEAIKLFLFYCGGLLISGLSAYIEMLVLRHNIFNADLTEGNEGYLRAMGFFYNPNEFGLTIVIVITVLLFLYFSQMVKRKFIIVLVFLLVPPLLFSYSRNAWVCLVISVILLAKKFADKKHRTIIYMLTVSVMLVLFAILFSVSEFRERLLSLFSGSDASALGRFAVIASSYETWLSKPFMGIGVYISTTLFEGLGNDGLLITIHSFYLHSLFEMGIIGFVITMGLLYSLYFSYKKNVSLLALSVEARQFSQLCLIILAVFYFYIVSGNHINYDFFWYLIAIQTVFFRKNFYTQKHKINLS